MAAEPGHRLRRLVKVSVDQIPPIFRVELGRETVDPTRSQNITVIGRRSAETAGPLDGAGSDCEARASAGGFGPASAAIASSNCSRSPRAETPMSLRSSFVSRSSRSALILLSRKFVSYCSRPRPRSHPATSMAVPHMAWSDNRLARAMCLAAQSVLSRATDGGFGRRIPLQLSLERRLVFEAHARHRRDIEGRLAINDLCYGCLSCRRDAAGSSAPTETASCSAGLTVVSI
jgi:hypothetical protein